MSNDRIKQMFNKYTEYDMIQTHTDLPEYPDSRIKLLYTFLSIGSETQRDYSELYALVTSLVQMGLDTHDLVDSGSLPTEERGARSRQLKVLAGDYFSSRFYHLLSQAGQIDTIKHLSHAICEVNRLKMNLYVKMKQLKCSAEEYMKQTIEIKMQLFLSFSRLMEGRYVQSWADLLHSFTKCEVLLLEMKRMDSVSHFRSSWAYWQLLQLGAVEETKQLDDADEDGLHSILAKYNIRSLHSQMLDSQLKQLMEKVEQFDSEKRLNNFKQILTPFMRYHSTSKVLEEI